MADLFRPAVRAAFRRWREVGYAAVVLAFGLWWGAHNFGFFSWIGFAVAALGAALIVVALQRLRFGSGGDGAGVVQVDERQLSYFGPLSGGVIDLPDLVRVDLDPTGHPAHWVLTDLSGQMVHIPVDAAGAEALFDVFAALPGIRTGRMLEALNTNTGTVVEVWQSAATARLR